MVLILKLADVSFPVKRILSFPREFVFDISRSSGGSGTLILVYVGELNPGLIPAIPFSRRIDSGTA